MNYRLQYEDVPMHKPKAHIKRKAIAKMTTDMSKLSTLHIIWYLIKRHQVDLLIAVVCLQFALFIYIDIMR